MIEKILLARHICLLTLAITCVYTDMARGKLYNSVTISGLCLGLALAFWLVWLFGPLVIDRGGL